MTLRRLFAVLLVASTGAAAWAQAPDVPASATAVAPQDYQHERDRIAAQRKEVNERSFKEETACYQRFAVQDCLRDSRNRRRAETDELKRQEAIINDIERKRRGAEQFKRIEGKQGTPRSQDRPEQQEQARQSQRGREQRAADHAASRAATAAEAQQRQQTFENKQRHHAQDRAKAAARAAQAPVEASRFERKQASAEQRRAERARRNAAQTKPPAAPLPDPPR